MNNNIYKPSLTISLLHQTKRSYQINLIKSNLIVFVLLALIVICSGLFDSSPTTTIVFDIIPIDINDFSLVPQDPVAPMSYYSAVTAQSGYGLIDQYMKVIKRKSMKHSNWSISEYFVGQPLEQNETVEIIDNEYYNFFGESFSDGGYNLPKVNNLIEIAGNRFPIAAIDDISMRFRGVDSPVIIKISGRPKIPSRAAEITGHVKIEFILTKKGMITEYKLLSEEPLNMGFAESIKEIIYNSFYWPGRVNGEKIDSKVTLDWTICPGNECVDQITTSEQLVINR